MNECKVWWTDTRHRRVDELIGVLSDVERARAAGFHREQDRVRFVTGSWLLRGSAGALLGIAPAAVPVDRRCDRCGEPHGRPRITGFPVDASISHSGTRVGVALSHAGPVGLDLEEVAPMPGGIVWGALAPPERAALRRLPEADRPMGFLRVWTCKEAVLKATGQGLRVPPDQVEVAGPYERPALRRWPLETPPESVTLHSLDPGGGYVAVVALIAGRAVSVSEIALARPQQPRRPSAGASR